MMHRLLAAAAVAGTLLVAVQSAQAQVQYVKVCKAYGAGWAYIPGSETCYNVQTGETRTETDDGTVYGLLEQTELANEGIAISLALPDATIDPGKTFGIAVNVGTFEGHSALGLGAAIRAGEGLTLNSAVGIGAGQGAVGGKVGMNFSW